jgi:hypothetical protein
LGSDHDLQDCLKDKVSAWEHAVGEPASAAVRCPQTADTGLQKSLQNECHFVQCIKPGIGEHFKGVEKELATKFLLALFGESLVEDDDKILVVLHLLAYR